MLEHQTPLVPDYNSIQKIYKIILLFFTGKNKSTVKFIIKFKNIINMVTNRYKKAIIYVFGQKLDIKFIFNSFAASVAHLCNIILYATSTMYFKCIAKNAKPW